MNKQGNRRSLKWLALLAAVSLFVWLAYKTGLSKIVLAVQQMGAGFLLLVLISAARHAFRTVAWQNCIRPGQRKLSWIHLFNIRLAGEAVADLTFLGPLLGETVRIVTASKRLSAPDSLSSVVMEDLLYSFSLFLFMPGGLFILIPTLAVPSQIKFASILLTLALFLPVLAAYALVRNRWALLDRLLDRLRKVDGRWNVLVQNRDKVDLFKERGLSAAENVLHFWR